jgi:hypothetical protein
MELVTYRAAEAGYRSRGLLKIQLSNLAFKLPPMVRRFAGCRLGPSRSEMAASQDAKSRRLRGDPSGASKNPAFGGSDVFALLILEGE